MWPISARMNNAENGGAAVLEPVELETGVG
jgi:hypothetical protein